jgi:hypothetical protein
VECGVESISHYDVVGLFCLVILLLEGGGVEGEEDMDES